MKKLLLMVLLVAFIMGCGKSAVQSEFWNHNTMYKSWDHMAFSLSGHKNPTQEHVAKAKEQGWWGIDVVHTPDR